MLAGFGPRFGLDEQTALKAARSFGGSVGLGFPCGAVVGALMVLGLAGGEAVDSDKEQRDACNKRAREFARHFTDEHGSLLCRDLLGLDMANPDDYKKALDDEVFKKICPALVKTAGAILERMLQENKEVG